MSSEPFEGTAGPTIVASSDSCKDAAALEGLRDHAGDRWLVVDLDPTRMAIWTVTVVSQTPEPIVSLPTGIPPSTQTPYGCNGAGHPERTRRIHESTACCDNTQTIHCGEVHS